MFGDVSGVRRPVRKPEIKSSKLSGGPTGRQRLRVFPHHDSYIMRVNPEDFRRLDLRAHDFLGTVPLHDVWSVRLTGATADLTIPEVLRRLKPTGPGNVNAAGRVLFWVRSLAGKAFGWDKPNDDLLAMSYVSRLTDQERSQSLEVPGTSEGLGTVVYTFEREALREIINRTVHAFLLFVFVPGDSEGTLYWAVYVAPVNGFTRIYMAVIDPFRRWLIYPSMARRFETAWEQSRIE